MSAKTLALLLILCFGGALLAQTPADSARIPADSMFVIPAGPPAGTFTPSARLTVLDTIAGWARIQVEGWVPVHSVLGRMTMPIASPEIRGKAASSAKPVSSGQCEGITKKGTRCKRKAAPGSRFCWQHQP